MALLPFSGGDSIKPVGLFNKDTEKATPGYYAVRLDNFGVNVELTSTDKVGFHKYTYDNPKDRRVMLDLGHIPSFCTACYREGRTSDRFMSLVKRGQIANCCQPNALMTLKEYLEDYASPETKEVGEALIKKELEVITNPKVKEKATEYIEKIHEGNRDFRF